MLPPNNTPADLLLLLGRLDGKLDMMAAALANISARADHHDGRIGTLEVNTATLAAYVPRFIAVEADVDTIKATLHKQSGRQTGWFEASSTVKTIIGLLVALSAYFGYQMTLETADQNHSKTVIERTITAK